MKLDQGYEGKAEPRRTISAFSFSRFRSADRALTDAELALYDEIRSKAGELAAVLEKVKPGRYRHLAVIALEESVMWTEKELTS